MTKQVNTGFMGFQRRRKDVGIGGIAARWYDSSTRRHRLSEMQDYAMEAASRININSEVLEVAPGPGYLSIELAKIGSYKIAGLDISKDFVEIARKNAKEAGVTVDFQQGSAAKMPFPAAAFDFIMCTAAFKNFKEPERALGEMRRVLKPGGRALIIDMNRNSSDEQIEVYLNNHGATGAERIFLRFMFRHFLRNGAYTSDDLAKFISRIPFREFDIKEKGISLYAYLTK